MRASYCALFKQCVYFKNLIFPITKTSVNARIKLEGTVIPTRLRATDQKQHGAVCWRLFDSISSSSFLTNRGTSLLIVRTIERRLRVAYLLLSLCASQPDDVVVLATGKQSRPRHKLLLT